MTLKIEIEMENAAFDPDPGAEAARILADLAKHLARDGAGRGDVRRLMDSNGNNVGKAQVTR